VCVELCDTDCSLRCDSGDPVSPCDTSGGNVIGSVVTVAATLLGSLVAAGSTVLKAGGSAGCGAACPNAPDDASPRGPADANNGARGKGDRCNDRVPDVATFRARTGGDRPEGFGTGVALRAFGVVLERDATAADCVPPFGNVRAAGAAGCTAGAVGAGTVGAMRAAGTSDEADETDNDETGEADSDRSSAAAAMSFDRVAGVSVLSSTAECNPLDSPTDASGSTGGAVSGYISTEVPDATPFTACGSVCFLVAFAAEGVPLTACL